MKFRAAWIALGAASVGLATMIAIGGLSSACSSNSSTTGSATTVGDAGTNDAGNTNVINATTPTSCAEANNALSVAFSPMYSAFDGTHTFQIPSIVLGVKDSVITWGSSDPSMVDMVQDPTEGGILITTKKAGQVTIVASAGSLCGSSVLTVTAAQPGDWDIGNARYNDGVSAHFGRGGVNYDAGADGGGPACTNCHGPTATDNRFKTVAHTPEQAGGFSDQDLVNIIVNGMVPDGGYFDPSIVNYSLWQSFHKWTDIQDDQKQGMVIYLRSLTPTAQTGSFNFGGVRDGGGRPPPPQDSGNPPADAANDG